MAISQAHRHVLVVGGAGYIGSVLCHTLLAQGYRVRVLDALIYDNSAALDNLTGQAGFSFCHGDMRRGSDVAKAMDGVSDVVLLAALVGDPICRHYPELAFQINQSGTLQFVDRLNDYNVGRFIFMSTCSNYGLRDSNVEATEESELNPRSLYAETKVHVEQRLLGQARDFSVTVLRSATAYGISPRMRFDLTVNEFTRELVLGNELLVYDADAWRPYCHVEDIAEAVARVLAVPVSKVNGQVFNVGRVGENFTKRILTELLCDLIPASTIKYRPGVVDPRDYRVSFEKIRDRLAYAPRHSVKSFLPDLIGMLRNGEYVDISDRLNFYGNYSIVGSSLEPQVS